jgi:hypothetical protein
MSTVAGLLAVPASGMRTVDTNVLVRLVVRDDANQVRAAEGFIHEHLTVTKVGQPQFDSRREGLRH